MSSPRTASLQKALSTYPFPLAFVLRTDVLDVTDPGRQAEGLIRLANTALHYAALVAVGDYAAAPFRDEQVSYRLERLKRPFISDFGNFLRAAVPALQRQGVLFIPELAASLRLAQEEKVRALRMGERGLEEGDRLPLLDALVNLRNALAHDRYRGRWQAFVDAHTPLVARFLDLLGWCAGYPLLRLVGAGRWVRLMGATPTFTAEPIPDAALTELARSQRQGQLTGLLLADPGGTRFLTLDPFVLWDGCPQCVEEPLLGLTEEVFLFNGDEGRRYVAYVGARHPRPLSAPKPRVDDVFAAKEVPPEPVRLGQATYPLLYGRAERQSEVWLRENVVARRYIPQVYFPRREMESEVEAFLRGRKAGFLLQGEAGMGKTNLLCRKIEQWHERGEIVLFYAGHQLDPEASLEERLVRDLCLTGEFVELLALLRREGRRLLLVVDGVNEHPQAPALLAHLCAFIRRYAVPPGGEEPAMVRVVLSFRSAFFKKTLDALFAGGGDEGSLFPPAAFQMQTVHELGRPAETYRFTLERALPVARRWS
jgi:hypothetical protein